MDFTDLKKNIKKNYTEFKNIRIALLADSATQLLAQAIRGWGYEYSLDLRLFEADFNQIDRQIMDFSSELYAYDPEITIIFQSSHKLLNQFNKLKSEQREAFADEKISHLEGLVAALSGQLKTKIIYLNLAEIDDTVFGNYSNKVMRAFLFQLRKFNYNLMEKARQTPNLFICDLSSIQNRYGKEKLFSPSTYINTEMVLSIDILPVVGRSIVNMIATMNGRSNKCLVLDLDNTLWGGVIGDDGIENIHIGMLGIGKAFTELQYWIKSLQERGIILAVCSKNDEAIAKEPFVKHPDMVLRLEHFAVFIANWDNKANNIRKIQTILNIGFDSMVFLDDNPFERNIVRENIPGINVPELPVDPEKYLSYLYDLNLFETVSYSGEDASRTQTYQVEAKRELAKEYFTNEEDFLKSLNMVSDMKPFNLFTVPRVSQLSQRSNQFNLRTVRYLEDDIQRISEDDLFLNFTFTLEDKFGDNGLICVVILKKEDKSTLFIDTWFMSCRVLKRGMENFTLNALVKAARRNGFKYIKGEYIPTPKNNMVKDHYKNLGFSESSGFWILNVQTYDDKECYIVKKN